MQIKNGQSGRVSPGSKRHLSDTHFFKIKVESLSYKKTLEGGVIRNLNNLRP